MTSVYTSAALISDTPVAGPPTVTLHVATSAVDTDFTAKLVDIEPSGYCLNVSEGIVRARYRRCDGRDELLEPGYLYEFVIRLHDLAHTFQRGHRIRLEVSSSTFPRFARNLNSSIHPNDASTSDAEVAVQVIYHDPTRASRLTLPVLVRQATIEASRQP